MIAKSLTCSGSYSPRDAGFLHNAFMGCRILTHAPQSSLHSIQSVQQVIEIYSPHGDVIHPRRTVQSLQLAL